MSDSFQRAIVKTRIVTTGGKISGKVRAHMNYITRDGAGADEKSAELFGSDDQTKGNFVRKLEKDDRHFRLIISPENAPEDMEGLTRSVMSDMEKRLDTKLEWKAVIHENTDHPHAHIVLRGIRDDGENLHIPNVYLTRGIRETTQRRLTQTLGYRTELDQANALMSEVDRPRVTSLDRMIVRHSDETGRFEFGRLGRAGALGDNRVLLINRANKLVEMGAAQQTGAQAITLAPDWEAKVREHSHFREMEGRVQSSFAGEIRESVDLRKSAGPTKSVIGEVKTRGLADELHDRPYVVIDGADGRAYHTTFKDLDAADGFKRGAIVRITPARNSQRGEATSRPFIAVIGPGGVEKSINAEGANWLDEYARGGAGAESTLLQKRLKEAASRRRAHHAQNGRHGVLDDDSRYEKWLLEERNKLVPPSIRKAGKDETARLLFGKGQQSFDGVMTEILETNQGPFGVVRNPMNKSFATVSLSANQRSLMGQPVSLRSMNQRHQNRILVQLLTRSR
ncbi:DUF3363 domain-containing protein [Nisaea sediminum]|uniref:DUF3363 domain-containing protein n=2 Tax=Pseudomonadota TaxID=1224 RepID=UPI001868C017|nr:DUF3363 domain-containing protein [Nisaea sediminum]